MSERLTFYPCPRCGQNMAVQEVTLPPSTTTGLTLTMRTATCRYCEPVIPAPRREGAAGADEETPIRLAVKELLDAIALHPRGSTMTRHAIDKIVDLHIDALDEATAALSTAEREREELRDAMTKAAERLTHGRNDGGLIVHDYFAPYCPRCILDRALAPVPSGGEEGRS